MVVFPHVVNQLSKHYEWNILSFSHRLVVSPFITEWTVIQSLDLVWVLAFAPLLCLFVGSCPAQIYPGNGWKELRVG